MRHASGPRRNRAVGICVALAGKSCLLQLNGTKEIERATITRIGHYQFRFPDFPGNASYRGDNLAPLEALPTKQRGSISVHPHCLAALFECILETTPLSKSHFF